MACAALRAPSCKPARVRQPRGLSSSSRSTIWSLPSSDANSAISAFARALLWPKRSAGAQQAQALECAVGANEVGNERAGRSRQDVVGRIELLEPAATENGNL